MTEEIIVLCPTAAVLGDNIAGSRLTACDGCQEPVWFADRTAMRVARENPGAIAKVLCEPCLIEYQAGSDEEPEWMLTPEQAAAKLFLPNRAEAQVLNELGVPNLIRRATTGDQ